jgi:hypothetical protein
VTPETWWGQRDHSWGIRAEMRSDETAPPLTFYPPFLFLWITVQFADYGLQLFLKERAPGDTIYITGEEVRPVGTRSRQVRRLAALTHEIDWADDPLGQTVKSARLEPVYGGLDGWFHGDDRGSLFADHQRWTLADPAARRTLRTLSDHVIEVRDGDNVGWGIMEYGVGEGYDRYPKVQMHPAI